MWMFVVVDVETVLAVIIGKHIIGFIVFISECCIYHFSRQLKVKRNQKDVDS